MTRADTPRRVRDGAREPRRARQALVALLALGMVACGESDTDVTGPETPGSISLTTETSGFLQDDSYELLVDGESKGTIGANDVVTVPDLEPATYEVALGDVADNCTVTAVSIDVVSAETADVLLSVVCAPEDPVAYTLRADRDRPNLEDGVVADCLFGLCPGGAQWDLYVYYNFQNPQFVIRQNQSAAVEIAHLPGVTLAALTENDVATAAFTTDLVPDPFQSGRVILIRTDQDYVYALGNPVSDNATLKLSFDAALLVTP